MQFAPSMLAAASVPIADEERLVVTVGAQLRQEHERGLSQAGTDSDSPNWAPASVHQCSIVNPAADSSAATPSGRNLADTSVRISSPSANATVSPISGRLTICRMVERSRISIH